MTRAACAVVAIALLLTGACARSGGSAPDAPAPSVPVWVPAASHVVTDFDGTQLVVVTTPSWDATTGVLRRFARDGFQTPWRQVGALVPVVVGRAGLAWGLDGAPTSTVLDGPRKREGDGRAPAGMFPLDTAFGFDPAAASAWVRLPYAPLAESSECVDDVGSRYYNTVVRRDSVPAVDWTSAERMRSIDQYKLGVIVGYNARPPVAGRGSCIFLHIWAGPDKPTSGCTAMPERDLSELMLWLDRARRPMLAQFPEEEYARARTSLSLP
jgi:D-alanyl-D-alanine dipeptidase